MQVTLSADFIMQVRCILFVAVGIPKDQLKYQAFLGLADELTSHNEVSKYN
jgi:hypothetical protein